MDKNTQKIEIDKIIVSWELYPRKHSKENDSIVGRYENLLRLKEKFPPIVVNHVQDKYYLIDGLHRLKANQQLGKVTIQAIIHEGLTDTKALELAIELNKAHGYRLDLGDLIYSAKKLEKNGVNVEDISRIVGISVTSLKRNFEGNQRIIVNHHPTYKTEERINKVNEIHIEWETCTNCNGTGRVRHKT